MLHFEWLWVWFLLPLPLLIRWLMKPAPTHSRAALRISFIDDFSFGDTERGGFGPAHRWLLISAGAAWLLLVIAASRPQWVDEITKIQASGRDLMLAVDISGSMKTEDFALNNRRATRLQVARSVAADFIKQREGDRIGLIVFGAEPYLQMPLSFDLETVRDMLNSTFIGLAGEKATAIGDSIGLAIKRLRAYEESNRVLILLTDGINNAGNINPMDAADVAAQQGMKIYTIGIGSVGRSVFSLQPAPELDEDTLKKVAQKTGGRYFRATNTKELREIYAILDKLEVIERDQKTVALYTELYPWPLALAGLIAFLLLLANILQRGLSWSS